MGTNNVTRLLQSRKIPFTSFDLPPEKLGAQETAKILGVTPSVVFKTIVIIRERGKPLLAVIPGDREANLKAIAAVIGEKKVHLPTEREAERLTGLQAGGISPLALLHKGFQVLVDESALQQPEIHISGGLRGLNIRLKAADLITLADAQVVAISHPVDINP